MSTNVILKRSAVAGNEPTLEQLNLGEIAINTNDGKLFFKQNDGVDETIVTVREITEDTLVIDPAKLHYSTATDLSTVLDNLDQKVKDLEDEEHISSVVSDTTLSGDGTAATPLSVNYATLDGRYIQAEVDTLQSVTDRGASTTNEIQVPSIEIGDFDNEAGAKLSWNAIDGTVDLAYDGVTLQLGQEQHVYGKAVGAIPNGAPVMFAGAQGDHILITRADQTVPGFNPKWILGLATSAMANNEYGYATTFGNVRGLDTSAFNEGDILYLDTSSPGALTATQPSAPNHVITMAAVTRSHATEGTIFSRPSWSLDLHELCDVNMTHDSAGDGDLLQYNKTTKVWDNTATPTVDSMVFRPDEDLTQVEGLVYYNDEYKALTVYNDITGSSLQVGHEEWVRVYNDTGSTIANGTPVYTTGSFGELPTIAPSDATTETKARVIGVVTNDIANNSAGVVTVRGLISGIDTSSLTEGSSVHLSPTGGFQSAAPTFPYFPTDLGECVVSDATNGYIYVTVEHHTYESFRVTGNTQVDGNLNVVGDLVVQGTQTITNEANLSISDSFIYLNSGDTIGLANTTFSGTGLDDGYFNNHYEGTTTETYYVRIDGVGTGTGGVDTFEWSKDNFTTTEATGVDLAENVDLDNNLCFHWGANTGHTLGDTWSGVAAPVNVDTGWFTNYNTGTTGVGYTHAGVFLDVSDGNKFKFISEYSPEPSGNIDSTHESFTLGTVVADTFEGTATDSDKLNNQLPSYYLNYSNFTNTPTIGNGTITITAGDGLATGGSFGVNDTGNSTVTLTNDDKGSSQNIFKSFSVTGQDTVYADSNNEDLELIAGTNVTITTDDTNKQITITSTDTNDNDNDFLTGLSFNTTSGVLTASVQNQSDVTVDLDDRYVLITDNPTSSNSTTIPTTSSTVVDTFLASTYRTAKYLVQITAGTEYHVTEILLIHDGTQGFITEYGTVTTSGSLGDFTVNVSGNNVNLVCTPTNAGAVVKVHRLNVAL